jgi:transglutaminase-like putative cysteine protease
MLISIRHTTRYTYDVPSRYAIQTLRLTPPSFAAQTVLNWTIEAPGIDEAVHFTDGFGNAAALVATNELHTEIEIVAHGRVETTDCTGLVRGLREAAPVRIYLRQTAPTKPDAAIREIAAAAVGDTPLERLHALSASIRERVDYETGTTTATSTAAEALAQGRGVCQDHAHVFLSAARCLDVPARYVNGYYVSGASEPEAAHHAWAEAYVDGLGWVGFDVANKVCPDDHYVRLACGLDAASASPIRGSRPLPFGAASMTERLDVVVDVKEVVPSQSQSQSQQ